VAHIITTPQVNTLSVAVAPMRWAPAGFGALVAAAVTTLRKVAFEPGMPRMSSEWLLSHDRFSGRRWTN
jgi:hypothetical protein